MAHNDFDLGSKSSNFLKNGTKPNGRKPHIHESVEEVSVFAHPSRQRIHGGNDMALLRKATHIEAIERLLGRRRNQEQYPGRNNPRL
jgi:hypothetical protein